MGAIIVSTMFLLAFASFSFQEVINYLKWKEAISICQKNELTSELSNTCNKLLDEALAKEK